MTTAVQERPGLLPPEPDAGVLGQTIAFHRDPLGFFRAASARQGDMLALKRGLLTLARDRGDDWRR